MYFIVYLITNIRNVMALYLNNSLGLKWKISVSLPLPYLQYYPKVGAVNNFLVKKKINFFVNLVYFIYFFKKSSVLY